MQRRASNARTRHSHITKAGAAIGIDNHPGFKANQGMLLRYPPRRSQLILKPESSNITTLSESFLSFIFPDLFRHFSAHNSISNCQKLLRICSPRGQGGQISKKGR
jgi:hypothetical protein